MTFYAKLWTDIIGDEKLMRGARKGGKQLVLLPWLIAFAKKADDNGRLSIGEFPAEPDDIAAGIPGVTPKQVNEGLQSLKAIGVLVADDDDVLRFAAWEKRNWSKVATRGASDSSSREDKESLIYYARCGDEVKIGISKNPWSRVAELSTARPGTVLLAVEPGNLELERQRQAILGGRSDFTKKGRGSEWFPWTPEIEQHVIRLNATRENGATTENRSGATTEDRSSATEDRSIARTRSRDEDEDRDLDGDKDSSSSSARTSAHALDLVTGTARRELDRLLSHVPVRESWLAEMDAALSGMHGVTLTPEQLGQAIHDYVGNGAASNPSLKHFRGYLRSAAGSADAGNRSPPNGAKPHRGIGARVAERTRAAIKDL